MGDKKSTSFENKYTVEDLRIMQSWSLQRKIQVTQTRIIEWYQKNNGKVYVSFSGGKDSTVLLDLARRIYPDIPAVFIDTGLEYPELREFVKSISNVVWLKPDMNFRKVIETYGYPIISKNVSRAIHDVKKLGNNCWSARAFDGRENGEIIKDKDGKYHTTKCNRTGCVFCGFGCHLEKEPNRFQRLKETHPKLWEYCMRDWNSGGLGMKSVLEYIGVKIE